MDFQSAMETFAEAWVAANSATKPEAPSDLSQQPLPLELAPLRCKTPPTRRQSPAQPRTPPAPDQPDLELEPKKDNFNILSKTISAKSLPVHCVVECVSSLEEGAWRRRPTVETDSYVIIPAGTAFQELVAAALMRLGYPHDAAAAAKGSVVINNWKPLPLERISEGPLATVGDILGELTAVATLRIQLLRPRASSLQDIKDKLLRLLLAQSRPLLMSTGCPLDDITLAQICRGQAQTPGPHNYHEPSEEVRRKFEQWWNMQVSPRPSQYSPRRPPSPSQKLNRSPSLNALPEHVHPALQTVQNQYPTQKTRMRTSFDPELELPKLQRWFAENQHPSRQQIQQYVRELNSLESRRGRKPLDVNNVVYWFKNARAAQKRAELRSIGPGGLSCHLSVNGYNSRSHSPANGSLMMANDSYLQSEHNSMKSPMRLSSSPARGYPMSVMSEDNMSNAGSDLEDEGIDGHAEERPETPEAPLSLITTKKDVQLEHYPRESPKAPDIIKVNDIKQEPKDLSKPEDMSPQRSPTKHSDSGSTNNNNNENGVTENNVSDDEDDHSVLEDSAIKPRRLSEDSLPTHPMNHEINRQSMHVFRSPSPSEIMQGGQLVPRSAGNLERLTAAGFPMVPNPMFSHGIMYMSHYIPGLTQGAHNLSGASPPTGSGLNLSALTASASDERRKRNRTFIDPVSEVPVLEQWFSINTHPSHNLILKYTEELNRMPYRQKFPRLESKNVQFWFKNRRAKCKRLKMSLYDPGSPGSMSHYHGTERKLS